LAGGCVEGDVEKCEDGVDSFGYDSVVGFFGGYVLVNGDLAAFLGFIFVDCGGGGGVDALDYSWCEAVGFTTELGGD